jgi:hypothetical protein
MNFYRSIGLSLFLSTVISFSALSHSQHFSPEENDWLNRQHAVDGTKCCDETDAHIGHDFVEWRVLNDQYQVLINERWIDVPPGRMMRNNPEDPTPWPGQPHLFYTDFGRSISIWCFFPPPLM